jgi:predicted AlkP superfamily phosphohydrolase/phosphomutase
MNMTVIILGLDGASVDVISRIMETTSLPNFEKLLQPGKFALLKSVYPYLTGPAWASIFTGVNPGKHGIFDQVKQVGNKFVPSNYIDVEYPFLWDYASWAGKSVLCLGVPFMYPAPRVNGIYVSGRFCPKVSSFPDTIEKEFDLSGYDYKKFVGLRNTRTLESSRDIVYRMILTGLSKRINLSIQLFDRKLWDLVIIVDSLPDDILHIAYQDKAILAKIFKMMDNWLGQIIVRLRKGDTLIVLSDHGFTSLKRVFHLRRWLWGRGYIKPKDSILRFTINRIAYRTTGMLGLKPSLFLALRNSKLFSVISDNRKRQIKTQTRNDKHYDVEPVGFSFPTAWIRLIANHKKEVLLCKLRKDLHELVKYGILTNVFSSEDVYWGKHRLNSPGEIVVEAAEGTIIDTKSIFKKGILREAKQAGKGTHSLYGMLAIYGPSVHLSAEATLYDITPTCLKLLGLSTPLSLDGKPII